MHRNGIAMDMKKKMHEKPIQSKEMVRKSKKAEEEREGLGNGQWAEGRSSKVRT